MEHTYRSSAYRFLPVFVMVLCFFLLKTYIDSQFDNLKPGKTVIIRQELEGQYSECAAEEEVIQENTE